MILQSEQFTSGGYCRSPISPLDFWESVRHSAFQSLIYHTRNTEVSFRQGSSLFRQEHIERRRHGLCLVRRLWKNQPRQTSWPTSNLAQRWST